MKTIHIIGAGPAGLMAAQEYARLGYAVVVYDHKPAAARKFLVAGKGGFNLSHSEPMDSFLKRYNQEKIKEILQFFNNNSTVNWLQSIGVPTYIGSSGKIFPRQGIKPIELLQRWLKLLKDLNVVFMFGYHLVDFDLHKLIFSTAEGQRNIPYNQAVFALGGRSWSKTGSNGKWIELFKDKGIVVTPTGPSNSGVELLRAYPNLAGCPLKNVQLFNDSEKKFGELIFTDYGIEGSAVYYLNRSFRARPFPQTLFVDLKPSMDKARIQALFTGEKITNVLKKKLRLEAAKISLLKTLEKAVYTNPGKLAQAIKKFPLDLKGFRPIEEVISTFGGVSWDELDDYLSLHKFPNIQCCGEMLDWDAPTGGYLLQACFATGYFTAKAHTR